MVHAQPPAANPPRGHEPGSAGILPASECWLFPFRNTPAGSRRSRTRLMGRWKVRTKRRCQIQGFPRERLKSAVAWRANDCSRITVISSCPALDFSSARNVFRRPVVMPFRPAVGTSPPTNSRRARQPGFTRAGIGFSVATRFHLAEPVHVVRTDTEPTRFVRVCSNKLISGK